MKNYFLFRIQGESDVIKPIEKISAPDAQEAIKQAYGRYRDDWFDAKFLFNDSWTFEDAMNEGGTTGGEDSALFGYLPEMEDCWLITSEAEVAVLAVEEIEFISAMMKAICDLSR